MILPRAHGAPSVDMFWGELLHWKERVKDRIKYILTFLGGAVSSAAQQALTDELSKLIDILRGALGL